MGSPRGVPRRAQVASVSRVRAAAAAGESSLARRVGGAHTHTHTLDRDLFLFLGARARTYGLLGRAPRIEHSLDHTRTHTYMRARAKTLALLYVDPDPADRSDCCSQWLYMHDTSSTCGCSYRQPHSSVFTNFTDWFLVISLDCVLDAIRTVESSGREFVGRKCELFRIVKKKTVHSSTVKYFHAFVLGIFTVRICESGVSNVYRMLMLASTCVHVVL